jgi:hypothetical protein
MSKYKKVFVPNPNFKFDVNQLLDLADEIVYTCDTPMFDELITEEFIEKFEGRIEERLKSFNPNTDVVAYYGDSVIFALMIMFLSEIYESFDVARFSSKRNEYLVRKVSYKNFSHDS